MSSNRYKTTPTPKHVNLAPDIYPQRVVVEGCPAKAINEAVIKSYLLKVSVITQMDSLEEPLTHKTDLYGWTGSIQGETSGEGFYAREQPPPFITTSPPVLKYTLSEQEMKVLILRLLDEHPPRTKHRFICYRLDGSEELSNLGRNVEREVFEESFGNHEAWMKKIYGDHESTSTFFVVIDQENRKAVGALRAIRNSPAGLLTLRDVAANLKVSVDTFKKYHKVTDLDSVWDIGTLAVTQPYRTLDQHLISTMLYRACYLNAQKEHIKYYIMIVVASLYRTFEFLGFSFIPLAGACSFNYEGSPESTALFGAIENFFSTFNKRLQNAEESEKPALRLFARRFIDGADIDKRLMFDTSGHIELDLKAKL